MPKPLDPKVLARFPPLERQQMEDGWRERAEEARIRRFFGVGPGIGVMRVNDYLVRTGAGVGCGVPEPFKDVRTWTGHHQAEFSPNKRADVPMRFTVEVDHEKKTATLFFDFGLDVKYTLDSQSGKEEPQHMENQQTMGIFSFLKLQKPFDETLAPGGARPFNRIVIPLKETPMIDMPDTIHYHGAASIPFSFGPENKFKGTAGITFSVFRRVVKPG